ncbi:hemolysin XhlA [Yersinia mollaretii]|uniref:hemolysin XhlA n=1 Tax=Yersinia mollaretii TaxID=33060 RepID=UPI0011A79A92|nr:hemolysin XhlA [Yersinia mollaretii]
MFIRIKGLEDDVQNIKSDLAVIKSNYATKEDIASVRVELHQVRVELHQSISTQTKWLTATIIGTAALTMAIAKLMF